MHIIKTNENGKDDDESDNGDDDDNTNFTDDELCVFHNGNENLR